MKKFGSVRVLVLLSGEHFLKILFKMLESGDILLNLDSDSCLK